MISGPHQLDGLVAYNPQGEVVREKERVELLWAIMGFLRTPGLSSISAIQDRKFTQDLTIDGLGVDQGAVGVAGETILLASYVGGILRSDLEQLASDLQIAYQTEAHADTRVIFTEADEKMREAERFLGLISGVILRSSGLYVIGTKSPGEELSLVNSVASVL